MSYPIRVKASAIIIENDSILLVEFNDENGTHYNLPGGGVEPNEAIVDAVRRETKEEASIDVEVGPLAFIYEYAPHLNSHKYGEVHSLALMFDCKRKEGSTPGLPMNPVPNRTDVKWIKLSDLDHIILYPNIKNHIIDYAKHKRNIEMIEEQFLEKG